MLLRLPDSFDSLRHASFGKFLDTGVQLNFISLILK